MNIGIIGAGSIAEKLAEAINNVDGVNLYAISSRSLDKARAFAEKFNVTTWYEGSDNFYNDKDIDLVYVATPNSFHLKNTIDSLNSGKAVLCEKPFAMNLEESKKMVKLAKDKNLFLSEAMWTKYFPGVKEVKNILESGVLGDIVSVQGDLSYPLGRSKERLYKKSLGGGALLDLGIYPISAAHYFLGRPDRIQATATFADTGVDESTSVLFTYNSGVTALLTCSVLAQSPNEFIITCTKGWIRLNGSFHHPTSISYSISGKEEHKQFPRDTEGYEYQIEGVYNDFKNCLKESSTVLHKDTLEIMEILDTIREQIGYSFE